jgi:formate dehydrogenase iron-sulfur subunit
MSESVGFYTDTTVCIGCKACQVACHQWNDLPSPDGKLRSLPVLSGNSYDNTTTLSDMNWRHVKFIEQFSPDADRSQARWLMMSDVCKHCVNAPCLEVCPTGSLIRTEFDTVYINEPACNGCRDCVSACPFGVIHMSTIPGKNVAQKCTFCYDRLKQGLTPACAQACPTQSIRFGPVKELRQQAKKRVGELHQQGEAGAYHYGADDKILGGLNAFYLLVDKPEVYGLPSAPKLPSRSVPRSAFWGIFAALLTALGALFAFRGRARGKAAVNGNGTPTAQPAAAPVEAAAPATAPQTPKGAP